MHGNLYYSYPYAYSHSIKLVIRRMVRVGVRERERERERVGGEGSGWRRGGGGAQGQGGGQDKSVNVGDMAIDLPDEFFRGQAPHLFQWQVDGGQYIFSAHRRQGVRVIMPDEADILGNTPAVCRQGMPEGDRRRVVGGQQRGYGGVVRGMARMSRVAALGSS